MSSLIRTKTILIFTLFFITFSCKKDKNAEPTEEQKQIALYAATAKSNDAVLPGAGNFFIEKSLVANRQSQIIGKMSFQGDSIFFVGSTNSLGQASDLHTILMSKSKDNYLVTEFGDDNSSSIVYMLKKGIKGKYVIRTSLLSKTEKEVALIEYNWTNNTSKVISSIFYVDEKPLKVASVKSFSPGPNKIAGQNTWTKDCGTPVPDDSEDKFLDESLKFISCNGTHPINQPIVEIEENLKKVPNSDELMQEIAELKKQNGDFSNVFDKLKGLDFSKLKFDPKQINLNVAAIIDAIKKYLQSQGTDRIKLTVSVEDSDLIFNDGIDQYLKVVFKTAGSISGEVNTDPQLIFFGLREKNASDFLFSTKDFTRRDNGKVTFLVRLSEISGLKIGITEELEGVYGYASEEFNQRKLFNVAIKWIVPKLTYISGNNQIGEAGKRLTNSLVVKVINADGTAVKNWPVTWQVKTGNGFITSDSETNSLGLAQASWTFGSDLKDQQVEASIKNRAGAVASGSPLIFRASKEHPLLKGYYEVTYAWGDRLLLEVNNASNSSSNGKILYFDSVKKTWFVPSFSASFSAIYKEETDINQNPIVTISVSISTGGCLSESFKLTNLDPTKQTFTGSYTNARCYHDANLKSVVNLKYLGLSY